MPGAVHLSNTCSVPVIVLSSRTVILFNSCRLFLMQLFFIAANGNVPKQESGPVPFPYFQKRGFCNGKEVSRFQPGLWAAEMEVPDDVSDDCSNDAGTRAASWRVTVAHAVPATTQAYTWQN